MSPQRTPSPHQPWSLRLLGGLAFAWAGLVVGISFIEAPVKFTAPSLTLAVGLDVGRHVFQALNRAELILALASVGLAWATRPRRSTWVALGIVWAALLLQTVWLLPALDARAVLIIAGGTPEGSGTPLHLLYGLAEGAKVLALLAAGWLAPRAVARPRPAEVRRAPRSIARSFRTVRTSPITPHHETSSPTS
ncbi:MAG: hypothetical protein ABJF88_08275 [Rhodothermales bacterium]